MVMNLNAVMSIIFNVPAAIASTVRAPLTPTSCHPITYLAGVVALPQVVASRVVRRLNTWSNPGSEMLSVSGASGPVNRAPTANLAGLQKRSTLEGVHVRVRVAIISVAHITRLTTCFRWRRLLTQKMLATCLARDTVSTLSHHLGTFKRDHENSFESSLGPSFSLIP
jgi:hypothetical protein